VPEYRFVVEANAHSAQASEELPDDCAALGHATIVQRELNRNRSGGHVMVRVYRHDIVELITPSLQRIRMLERNLAP
jgi:hypothetical protein